MPTFERDPRFDREFRRLPRPQQRAFKEAVRQFVAGLTITPPEFAPGLRVKRVQRTADVWELTFAPDGRATFAYGSEVRRGEPHIIWRRIGDHSILKNP